MFNLIFIKFDYVFVYIFKRVYFFFKWEDFVFINLYIKRCKEGNVNIMLVFISDFF